MKKLKKIFSIITILMIALTIASCKSNDDGDNTGKTPSNVTVTFVDGNRELATKKIAYGNTVSDENVNTLKDGYDFDDWYSAEDFTLKFDFNTKIKSNITIYAHYFEIYSVSFNSNGGSECDQITYSGKNKITLPMPLKDGVIFDHWVDDAGNKYNTLDGDEGDLSLTAVYRNALLTNATYELNGSDYVGSSVKSDIYKINSLEITPRIVKWTNPSNSSETKEFTYGFKLASSTASLEYTSPTNGTINLYVQCGSSTAETVAITISDSENNQETITFAGNSAYGDYSGGSPVVRIQKEVKANVTYTIVRAVSKTVYVMGAEISTQIYEEQVTGIKITKPGVTTFVEGGEYIPKDVKAQVIYGNGKYSTDLALDYVKFDTSNVNFKAPGVYDVILNYGQFSDTISITIYEIKDIHLGFNATYETTNSYNSIYVNGKVQTIYSLNEELNTDYLTVTAEAQYGNKTGEFIVSKGITYSHSDFSKVGEYEVEVALNVNEKEFTASYTVYVVNGNAYTNESGDYVVTVDPKYDGRIGSMLGEDGNTFTTISQALTFLEKNTTPESNKILNICAGYYNEKIEINVANLTIRGAGTVKATYKTHEDYDATEYKNATIIEWNSIYGIPDESGFYQVTDSVATVAVREAAINCTIENLTISNYWNCEKVFIDNIDYLTEMGLATSDKVNDHRALALICQADQFTLNGCSLLGYQDTVEFMTGRQFVYNTYITGNTDFIFGTNATTYFYDCDIHVTYKQSGSGYVTAYKGCNGDGETAIDYGFIFDNCKFTADTGVAPGTFSLGRPWGAYSAVTVMNSEIGGHISKTEATRYVAMSGVLPIDETVRYQEYNNSGEGAITNSQNGVTILDSQTAAKYNDISIIFGTVNGKITYKASWIPKLYTKIIQ
ncbi:MAG: pectinesterase family protein [Anaeroplasmataceae bacterium]